MIYFKLSLIRRRKNAGNIFNLATNRWGVFSNKTCLNELKLLFTSKWRVSHLLNLKYETGGEGRESRVTFHSHSGCCWWLLISVTTSIVSWIWGREHARWIFSFVFLLVFLPRRWCLPLKLLQLPQHTCCCLALLFYKAASCSCVRHNFPSHSSQVNEEVLQATETWWEPFWLIFIKHISKVYKCAPDRENRNQQSALNILWVEWWNHFTAVCLESMVDS